MSLISTTIIDVKYVKLLIISLLNVINNIILISIYLILKYIQFYFIRFRSSHDEIAIRELRSDSTLL